MLCAPMYTLIHMYVCKQRVSYIEVAIYFYIVTLIKLICEFKVELLLTTLRGLIKFHHHQVQIPTLTIIFLQTISVIFCK